MGRKNKLCKYGTTETVEVTISKELSHTGKSYRKQAQIDQCIAPIVQALDAAGIVMLASCCGHGETYGFISLADGRTLIINQKVKGEKCAR